MYSLAIAQQEALAIMIGTRHTLNTSNQPNIKEKEHSVTYGDQKLLIFRFKFLKEIMELDEKEKTWREP